MKKTGRVFRALILLITWSAAHSLFAKEDVEVSALVDRSEAEVGEEISLTVTANSTRARMPDLSGLEPHFQVYSGGTFTSTQINNFKMSVTKAFRFTLVPLKAGTVKIPPIEVRVGGHIYRTEQIQMKIHSVDSQRRPKLKQSTDIFVNAVVDNRSPFENEQVTFTFKFFRRQDINIQNANLEEFKFDRFWVESPDKKQREYRKIINGVPYAVVEIRKALFPDRSGEVVIPPVKLSLEMVLQSEVPRNRRRGFFNDPFFDDFRGRRGRVVRKTLRTKPIKLKIQKLPSGGGKSRLVGQFSLKADISGKEVKQGDSLTLTLKISGRGNIRDAPDISIPASPLYKIYDDRPELKVSHRGGIIQGSKLIKKALVPVKPGKITIPAFELKYFQPDSGKWEIERTEPIVINVEKSEGERLNAISSESRRDKKKGIKLIGRDIFPIKTNPGAVWSQGASGAFYIASFLIIVLPGILYFVLFVFMRRKEELSENQALRRRKVALKDFNRSFKNASKERRAEKIEFCLREFLGNTLNVNGLATTPLEFEKIMKREKIEEGLVKDIVSTLDKLEGARFGASGLNRDEMDLYLKQTKQFVRVLKKRYRL